MKKGKYRAIVILHNQYFMKGLQMPKGSPKIGCGPYGAHTLFSVFSKLFRDLLIMKNPNFK